jgi:hypothetical protein
LPDGQIGCTIFSFRCICAPQKPVNWRAPNRYFREAIQSDPQMRALRPEKFLFMKNRINAYIAAVPHPQEGRIAIVTDVGCRMRWTFRLGRKKRRRTGSKRTAKSCGPDPPTLGSSLAVMIRKATVAQKPGTPRRSRISRKPLRGECRLIRLILW